MLNNKSFFFYDKKKFWIVSFLNVSVNLLTRFYKLAKISKNKFSCILLTILF